ncbi:MAG: TonB-dependent receptor [Paraglaciecola sp.]|nr:TonB-dependent receptor [Paraglaciecola sp.]NCT47636.1 TonB-dependent receptor [Paraglaciecola sp.]
MLIYKKSTLAWAMSLALTSMALNAADLAEETPVPESPEAMEAITVVGKSVSYANNLSSDEMAKQQSALTSVLAQIDNLPGVLINEGDTFGSDDWSTTVSIRGFQLSLDQQQIGITIDGIANGNSNYGGGAKANRYIDTENLGSVEVSQGTGDIASRSNEALGGTLNFTTANPADQQQMTLSVSMGNFAAQKYFVRYDTGEFAKDSYAWISVSSSQNSDWIDETAENKRDHLAAKFISVVGETELSGYVSWDDTHEDNYQRISLQEFAQNPEWDRLTSEWTGIPYVDQAYRRGWSTLRENLFTYLKADYKSDNIEVSANVYYHRNKGRGDWVPQYIVDVTNDGNAFAPHSELVSGNTVYGGSALGTLLFVNATGQSVAPMANCQSSITFPYGGAGAAFDPACYAAGAIPVGSYRHTHYEKQRFGLNGDFAWFAKLGEMENTLRGGIWYEDYQRDESRDWHKIIDSKTAFEYDHIPYWVQYDRGFPVQTTMLYLQDQLVMQWATLNLGIKQFFVDLERNDNFAVDADLQVNSDSDALFSAGLVVPMPIDGLELFAGYAQNFAAIKDAVLEADPSKFTNVEPETADNVDVGLRYVSQNISASLTYYDIKFENRLTFIPPDSSAGIDYLSGENGNYANVGGINSKGLEASLSITVNENWSLYGAYTFNDSTYADSSIDFPAGNTVFGSAENMWVVSADWQKENYFAGLSSKWVDERFIDAANTQIAPDYLITDLYAGVSVSKPAQGIESVELRFTVNNMFDESYLGGIAGQAAWIGAPRTAAMNLMIKF